MGLESRVSWILRVGILPPQSRVRGFNDAKRKVTEDDGEKLPLFFSSQRLCPFPVVKNYYILRFVSAVAEYYSVMACIIVIAAGAGPWPVRASARRG